MSSYPIAKFRVFFAALILSFLLLPPGAAHAKSAKEIDASADVALERFKKEVKGAEDYLKGAKGVLVMPNVKKVGLVIAGQWGEGVLRVDNKSVAY